MADAPGDLRPPRLSADLKAATGAIGWLAGSLSGVMALMYAVGFLCAKSHLNMLGIELYSGLAAGAYVEIGAKFFYITVIMLFEGLIDLGRTVLPACALFFIPALIVVVGAGAVVARIRRSTLRKTLRTWYAALSQWGPEARSARVVASCFLALVLLWGGSQYRNLFAPVQISGVLHMTCANTPGAVDAQSVASLLACKIRMQEHAVTRGYYSGLVSLVFGLFLVVVPFRRRFLGQGETRMFYFPLMLLFVIYSLVLPLTYGALVMPNDFPLVNITAKSNSEIQVPENPFYLIHQGEKFSILWHAGNAASYVIPASDITTLEVTGRASLFSDQSIPPKDRHSGGTP